MSDYVLAVLHIQPLLLILPLRFQPHKYVCLHAPQARKLPTRKTLLCMQQHRGILLGFGMNYAWRRDILSIYFCFRANYGVQSLNRRALNPPHPTPTCQRVNLLP